ncbi:MAG: hypothetical protein U1E40_08535 [Amaricoccus sp.]
MRRRPLPAPLLAAALLALVAACGPPPGAEEPISDAARAAPPPQLGATAQFDDALARAQPDADRLGAGSAELAARAAALRARAAAMSGPVVDPPTLTRLQAAVAPAS